MLWWVIVVAPLVDQLLLMPEIPSSNPLISKFYVRSTLLNLFRAENGALKYNITYLSQQFKDTAGNRSQVLQIFSNII